MWCMEARGREGRVTRGTPSVKTRAPWSHAPLGSMSMTMG